MSRFVTADKIESVTAHEVINSIDDSGSIHVDWQNGSNLAVIFREDECRKVEGDD